MNRVIEAVQNTLYSIQNAHRTVKITLQISLDSLIIFLSLVSAILLRIDTLGFIGLSSSRFLLRAIFGIGMPGQRKNLAVYGAGKAGIQILQSLKQARNIG